MKESFTNEELIQAWFGPETTSEMARRFGCARQTVTVRAHWLRTKGVNLPIRRRNTRVDVAALNELVRSIGEEK